VTRLALIAHAATSATRTASFAGDESIESAPPPVVRRHALALCSPGRACVQTASALGLRPRLEPRLRDWDYGRWQGRTLDDVTATEPDGVRAWLTDPDAAPHGGEALRDVLQRTRTWLHGLEPTSGTVIAVTHPSVVRAAIVAALGAGPAAFWRIDVPPLTETTLIGGQTRWTLRATGCPLTDTR
jgi:broad specificity phosphatase PhoE